MEWQDISTAPRDGTWILVYTSGNGGPYVVARWTTHPRLGEGWWGFNAACLGRPEKWTPITPPETGHE